MRISLNWLKDYIDLNKGVDVAALDAGLTQLGHEVDAVHDAGASFKNIVVGKVTEAEQHPNADKLRVCKVDVGATHGGVRQIVCGAPNARAGLTVAVALPGALVRDGFEIKNSRIRDVESQGMLCGLDEIGLDDKPAAGIWEMDESAVVGMPLAEFLGRNDTVLEISVTSNRGDCLSHLGIARELAALGLGIVKPMHVPESKGMAKVDVAVRLETPGCTEFNLMRVRGVKNAESPAWVRARLEAVGLRPKNILVDATNYVMMAVGHPLHAFDGAKLDGVLKVRDAYNGEVVKALTGESLSLRSGDMVIEDRECRLLGLAGIVGGASTAVSDDTSDVVLEAAQWERTKIAATGQHLKMMTDARYRFERGVDPALAKQAVKLCAALVCEWGGGEVSELQTTGEGVKAPKAIAYNPEMSASYGGLEVAEGRQQEILEKLGFGVSGSGTWQVTPPTYRTYMVNPEDVVEEVLRVVGYENIPATLPHLSPAQMPLDGGRIVLDRKARKALAAAGFLEAITYSFVGREEALRFGKAEELVDLENPLAENSMTTMRPSLLPGLLRSVVEGAARNDMGAKLGEVGKVFSPKGERLALAGILIADGVRNWRKTSATPDVFIAKAAALTVLELLGAPIESAVVSLDAGMGYHPGRSGTLRVGPMVLARFGELHPRVRKALGLSMAVAVFELDLEPLLKLQAKVKPWAPSSYQMVKRDMAFVLAADVPAAAVQATLRGVDRELIRSVEIFDMYQGEHVGPGKKSLALGLTIQAADRTLTEAEISGLVTKGVEAVKIAHGAELRG